MVKERYIVPELEVIDLRANAIITSPQSCSDSNPNEGGEQCVIGDGE